MPFASRAQAAYLRIHHPSVAAKFAAKTKAAGIREGDLPRHVGKSLAWDMVDMSRQGAHGTSRLMPTPESSRGDPLMGTERLVGAGMVAGGLTMMPAVPGILEHGVNSAETRAGRAGWRAARATHRHLLVPATRTSARQALKIKPVADVASHVPKKLQPLVLTAAGWQMMHGRVPGPIQQALSGDLL
jgi:hypothetical protein